MIYIAVLLTVFNRKKKTLSCLENLKKQKLPNGYSVEVWLTDDGCTDGTPEIISDKYPDVRIIKGNGKLFWNRGMWTAWNAASQERDYDFYLWLNDDTYLYPDAIEYMIRSNKLLNKHCIIAGATCSTTDPQLTTYSGFIDKKKICANGSYQKVEKFNGNFVLVPRSVFRILGFNDPYYRHSFGDIDYGMRANKKGIPCYITEKHIGTCELHERGIKCFDATYSLKQRYIHFYSPLGMNPIEFFHMNMKTEGIIKSIGVFVLTHLRVLFPQLWTKN